MYGKVATGGVPLAVAGSGLLPDTGGSPLFGVLVAFVAAVMLMFAARACFSLIPRKE